MGQVYASNGFALLGPLVEVEMKRTVDGEEQTLKLKVYADQTENFIQEREKAGWELVSRSDKQ